MYRHGEFVAFLTSADSQQSFIGLCVAVAWPVRGAALVQMLVVLQEKEGMGVPTDAIVQRADRQVVFVADNGTAAMRVVEVGLATDGWTEVTGGELKPDDRVVVQGQFLLDDGSAVRRQEGTE